MCLIGAAARISSVDRHFRSSQVLGKSSHLNGNRKFVTVFARPRHQFFPEPDETSPHPNLFILDPFQQSPQLRPRLPSVYFSQIYYPTSLCISHLKLTCSMLRLSIPPFDHRTSIWRGVRFMELSLHQSVAYPGILFGGGGQQIQLRTERTGIWERQPPCQGFWRQL